MLLCFASEKRVYLVCQLLRKVLRLDLSVLPEKYGAEIYLTVVKFKLPTGMLSGLISCAKKKLLLPHSELKAEASGERDALRTPLQERHTLQFAGANTIARDG